MTWSDEVCTNRIQVARVQGSRTAAPRRLMPAAAPQPNSGLGPLALAAGLVAASLYFSKEGHKLRGRKLHPVLEKLRRLLGGGAGRWRVVGTTPRRSPSAAGGVGGADGAQTQREQGGWQQQDARSLAAAAAEQRLQQQQQQQEAGAAPAQPTAAASSGAERGAGTGSKGKNKKNKSGKNKKKK